MRNSQTFDERTFLPNLFRGQFRDALASFSVSQATDRLINLKVYSSERRLNLDQFRREPNPNAEPLWAYLNTPSGDPESGYKDFKDLFRILKAADFSQEAVSRYVVERLIPNCRDKSTSGLDQKQAKSYTKGIVDAFRSVYTSEKIKK